MNAYLLNPETMQWPVYEGDLRLMYPNSSLQSPLVTPPTPWVWVQGTEQPTFDWVTQGIREIDPVENNGVWYQTWEVYHLSQEQVDKNLETMRQQNKQQAELLLQQTDWTATVDINNPQYSNPYLGNQDAFLAYRSQVRQIAVNPPVNVEVWPVKPEEQWISV